MPSQLEADRDYFAQMATKVRSEADKLYVVAAAARGARQRRLNVEARIRRADADLWRAMAEELDAYLRGDGTIDVEEEGLFG